ncbi:MAG: hypothetical protein HY259_07520 [Chloroflexi bacterium]|nr:hypothetical protein [Chloroflexota bacterium]MBI3733292.1 hypothetical protein [Chloroflexota bacterium]
MDSGTISKIQKARLYADERDERIRFLSFTVELKGDNNKHSTSFDAGRWRCDCEFFKGHAHCSHTMALERVLGQMLPEAVAAG